MLFWALLALLINCFTTAALKCDVFWANKFDLIWPYCNRSKGDRKLEVLLCTLHCISIGAEPAIGTTTVVKLWGTKCRCFFTPSLSILPYLFPISLLPSVLWRCWLGGRKRIRPVKNRVVRCWCGYLSGAKCRLIQLMSLPLTVSCFSKIQIGFTFLVPASRAVLDKGPLNGCV